MSQATVLSDATTVGGFLLVLAIMLPVAGILGSLVLGGRYVERIALVLLTAGFGVAVAVFAVVWRGGHSLAGAPLTLCTPVSRYREVVALTVALCAVLLGLVPLQPSELLQVGRPSVAGVVSR